MSLTRNQMSSKELLTVIQECWPGIERGLKIYARTSGPDAVI